jgi:hypothetical protein
MTILEKNRIFKFIFFPIIFYLVLFIIVFNKIYILDHHFINHDNFAQFYVYFTQRGFWNKYLGFGFPSFAEPQWQTFYPFKYLFPPTLTGFDYYILHFIMIGAYFTFLVSYEFSRNYLGSLISGIIFSLSGSIAGQISMLSIVSTSVFLPIIFYFCYKFLKENSFFWYVGLIFSNSLAFLSGHPQIHLQILIFIFLYAMFDLFITKDKSEYRNNLLKFGLLFLAIVFSLLITSFQLLPLVELTQNSFRKSKISFVAFTEYEFPLRNLINLIFPYFWGGIAENQFFYYVIPQQYYHIASHNFHELYRYFGLFGAFSLIVIFFIKDKSFRLFCIFSLVFFFLWTLGSQTIFSQLLYKLPVINTLRGPSRHFLEITFIVSILSSILIAELKSLLKIRTFKTISILYLLFLFFLPILYFLIFPEIFDKYKTLQNIRLFNLSLNNGIIFQYFILIFLLIIFIFFVNYKRLSILILFLVIIDLGINIQYIDSVLYASKKDLIYKNDKISVSENKRIYFQKPCLIYNSSKCPFYPYSNNLNALYRIPSSGVYSSLANFNVVAFNFLASSLNHILPKWNVEKSFFYLFADDYFYSYYLTINKNYDSNYNITIPKEIIEILNSKNYQIKLYFSLMNNPKIHLKKEQVILKTTINNKDTIDLIFEDNISWYENDCNNLRLNNFIKRINRTNCEYIFFFEKELTKHTQNIQIKFEPWINDLEIRFVSLEIIDTTNNKRYLFNGTAFYELNKDQQSISYFYFPDNKLSNDINYIKNSYLNQNFLIKMIEYNNVAPRIFFTNTINFLETSIFLYKLFDDNFSSNIDLQKESYIHLKDDVILNNSYSNSNAKVTLLEEKEYYLKLETTNSNLGFLVLLENFNSYWKAYIDNKEAKIYPANIVGVGIVVPQGKHTIEFKFYPNSLIKGIIVCIFSLLILMIALFFLTKRRLIDF